MMYQGDGANRRQQQNSCNADGRRIQTSHCLVAKRKLTQHPTWPVEAEGKWDTDTRVTWRDEPRGGMRKYSSAGMQLQNETKNTELNWEGISKV